MLTQAASTKKSLPLVSVLMPTYNSGRFIDAAIESILCQTYAAFELIVLDDGSTDNSAERIEHWAATDKRMRAARNDRNRGIVYTRNRLFSEASPEAKYFAIMDSDDISMPNRLAHQVDFLEANPDYGLVGGHNLIIDGDGRTVGIRRYPLNHEGILRVLTRYNAISQPTVMLRRSVIDEIGYYDPLLTVCEDYDLWFRMAIQYRIANLDEVTLSYRISPNQSKQQQLRRTIRHTLDIQRKWLLHPRFCSMSNLAYWCVQHGLLMLPERWVLEIFKQMAYEKPPPSN